MAITIEDAEVETLLTQLEAATGKAAPQIMCDLLRRELAQHCKLRDYEQRRAAADDEIVAVFQARARQAGRSLEEELRIHLTETAAKARRDIAKKAAATRQSIFEAYGTLSDSTDAIRKNRETRG